MFCYNIKSAKQIRKDMAVYNNQIPQKCCLHDSLQQNTIYQAINWCVIRFRCIKIIQTVDFLDLAQKMEDETQFAAGL